MKFACQGATLSSFALVLKSYPRLAATLIGCVAAFMMIVVFELIAQVCYSSRLCKPARASKIAGDYSNAKIAFFCRDKNLGYKPRPSVRVSSVRKYDDGEIIYNVSYSIDNHSRRIVPLQFPSDIGWFIVLFGCSFTFGEGLNDNETLAYYLAEFAPSHRPYNYAFCGYGPQQMLAKLEASDLAKEISEKKGIALCLGADVNRAIGSMYVHNGWGREFPYYYLDASGNVVRDGSFTSGRPILSLLYKHAGRSGIAKSLNLRHPRTITDEHVRLTAKIIEQSCHLFKKTFGSCDFYYVNFPVCVSSTETRLLEALRRLGIKTLDYGDRGEFGGREYRIEGDGHPSAKWNRDLAKLIVNDLKLGEIPLDKNGPRHQARSNYVFQP